MLEASSVTVTATLTLASKSFDPVNMASGAYFMPRNGDESHRVNKQGQAFENVFGYQVHPNITSNLPRYPWIADIGTATGDYLMRLSAQYPPDSEFHGFDISSAQFCPRSSCPENVQLHVHDLREPFPTEFHNKFDLVHFRMLQAGLGAGDWILGVRNAMDLLRPGGAIQWMEADLLNSKRLRGGAVNTTTRNLDGAIKPFIQQNVSQLQYGPTHLMSIFKEAGLTAVEEDIVSTDRLPEMRERSSMNYLKAVMGYMRNMRENGQNVDFWPGLELDEVERRALEDISKGAYTRTDLYCTTGFKLLEQGKL